MTKLGFGGKNILDIIKYRYVFLGISACFVIPCLCFMIYLMITLPTHSPVKLGIDFTGGTFLQYGFEQKITVNDIGKIRNVLAQIDQANAVIQIQEPTDILGKINEKTSTETTSQTNEDVATTNDSKTETTPQANEDVATTNDSKTETTPQSNEDIATTNDSKTQTTPQANKDIAATTGSKTETTPQANKDVATTNDSKAQTTTNDSVANPENTTSETSTNDSSSNVATPSNEDKTSTAEENNSTEKKPGNITTQSLDHSKVQTVVSMRVKFLKEDEIKKLNSLLREQFGNYSIIQASAIGPSLGKELLKNAVIALLLVFGGIVTYLSFRFQFDYAVCALIALLHDAVFVIGLFALFGMLFNTEVDSLFVTAVLTVIGFSVHDTIVVFDRVRENARFLSKKKSFNEICNDSVNQTLARSINTSLTTVIVLSCLYFFGGVTTRDFVLAMTLGIIVGTYSSIFNASVLLALWREINTPKKKIRKAVA